MKRVFFILSMLLVLTASVFANDDFVEAAKNGDMAKVREMLNSGVNVNAKSNKGNTALMFASVSGYTEILKLLISREADVNVVITNGEYQGYTAMMFAEESGNTEIVKLLKAAGAKY